MSFLEFGVGKSEGVFQLFNFWGWTCEPFLPGTFCAGRISKQNMTWVSYKKTNWGLRLLWKLGYTFFGRDSQFLNGYVRWFRPPKKYFHPPNLTWNLRMMVSERNLLFQGPYYRFHVRFQASFFFPQGILNNNFHNAPVSWYWSIWPQNIWTQDSNFLRIRPLVVSKTNLSWTFWMYPPKV